MNTDKTYNSIYRGVVIQNDDPSQGGRVKVFIPFIHASLINLSDGEFDKSLNFGTFGKNINKQNKNKVDLTEHLETLKNALPWATVIQPIIGETGNSKYNSSTGISTPSDSNDYESAIAINENTELGGGPASIYGDSNMSSIWSSGAAAGGVASSPSSSSLSLNKNYNTAKGSFAIPSVNTQVWVCFLDGNPQVPVVMGVSPTTSDWQQNILPSAYPGSYENKGNSKSASTVDETIYRNATVKNSGAITEITNNTTGNQSQHTMHISGTSQSINNDGTKAEFITSDSNKVVLGSNFSDIKGSRNVHVEGINTVVTRGDRISRIGSLNVSAAQGEKKILKNIDQTKALFETKRSKGGDVYNSLEQTQSGTGVACPECSNNKQRPALKGDSVLQQLGKISPIDLKSLLPIGDIIPKFPLKGLTSQNESYPKTSDCKVCGGTGTSPSSMGGEFPPETKKEQIGDMYVKSAPDLASHEQSLGEGGNDITEVTKNMVVSVGCAFNDMDAVRVDKEGKFFDSGLEISEDGPYNKKEVSPLIEPKHVDDLTGGTYTLIANNKAAFIVGAGGIKFQTVGIVEFHGAISNITGEQVNISSSNEVNIGGGGRLALEAKVLSLKSGGGQVLIDCNLSVKNNLIVQGGAIINGDLMVNNITAPMVFQPTEELMEAWGVTNDKEMLIKVGYLKMGDKITFNSITGVLDSNSQPCTVTGVADITLAKDVPVYSMTPSSKPDPRGVRLYAHRHWFRNLPITLMGETKEVYEKATSLSENKPLPPTPPKSGKTGPDSDKELNSKEDYDKNKDDGYTPASYADPE